MKRHITEQELIEYKFKLASDEQAAGAAEHLAGCAECRERLEMLSQKFAALDLLAEDVPASEELISQAIAQAKRPARRRIVPFGKYHWLASAAAVLALGLVVLIGDFGDRDTRRNEQAESAGAARYSESAAQLDEAEEQQVMLVAKDLAGEKGSRLEESLGDRRIAARSAPAPSITSVDEPAESFGIAPKARPDADASSQRYAFAPTRGRGPAPEKKDEAVMLSTGRAPTTDPTQRTTAAWAEKPQDAKTIAGVAGAESVVVKISEKPPFAPASAIELVTLPRRDSVQLTICNSADLTLVREKRNLTLKQGWNWLQLMWANTLIDPTSLSLEPAAQGGKIDVQQLVFPARLRELGRWLIRSEISGQVPFEITYFTSGLSWRAFYMGTLSQDEKKMRLQGYVRVANGSGEDYENAQTRLLVGKVNVLDEIADLAKRQYAYDRPGVGVDKDGDDRLSKRFIDSAFTSKYVWKGVNGDLAAFDVLDIKEIMKEGLSEYFLYTIEGTETIADKWGKRLPSFDVEDIDVESLYKYDEERWGNQTVRFVSFANDEEHNLGQTPIPDGSVKIFGNASDEGYLSYVGETYTKYIPVGEEIELNLGAARLVEIEPKLMEFKTDNYVFDDNDNVAGWDEIRTWEIEITNTRKLPVEIEITRGFGTPYWTLQTDAIYEKHDATHARFKTQLQPRSKQTLDYTVTTYHGRRQE